MSVVVRTIGRCSFPSGKISSLMMHERTWGTALSIVANCMTVERIVCYVFVSAFGVRF